MKNIERHKTAKERAEAFHEYCEEKGKHCRDLQGCECIDCQMQWLDLEADEDEPRVLPCPYCGGLKDTDGTWLSAMEVVDELAGTDGTYGPARSFHLFRMRCKECGYVSRQYPTKSEAIAAHNLISESVAKCAKYLDLLDRIDLTAMRMCGDKDLAEEIAVARGRGEWE